jgi:topoisomerase-4 subunit B
MVVAIRYSPVDRFSRRRLRATPSGGGKVDITRFKGLGEMQSVHLLICAKPRWTRPSASCYRSTCRLRPMSIRAAKPCAQRRWSDLMRRKPEKRYAFIQENARFARSRRLKGLTGG